MSMRPLSGLRRENTLCNQRPSELDIVRVVDVEHLNRHSSHGGQSDQTRTAPAEMIDPEIASRMEERGDLPRLPVYARKIRAFAPITSRASYRQVADLRLAAMLLGDDVVDLERPRIERLRKSAVFATSLCSLSHAPV